MVWIYAKIYGNEQTDEWYINMLKMIVYPVCNEYKKNIKHLYFTKYDHPYGHGRNDEEDMDGDFIPEDIKKPGKNEYVKFIRFRMSIDEGKSEEVKEKKVEEIKGRIIDLFMEKQGNELRFMVLREYDVEDDLGKRYGHSNLDYTLEALSGWCWYNLGHLNEHIKCQQCRINDLFHLINNISIQPLMTKCPLAEHQIIA